MIWLIFAVLIAMSLAVVVPPLVRREATATPGEATELAVYREQLREIDGDAERGAISPAEAEAARIEIKRRILTAPKAAAALRERGPHMRVAVALGAGLSLFSLALYLGLGRPALPGRPFDAAPAQHEEQATSVVRQVETMVAKLAERLKTNPDDAMGWRMLGWSYQQLGRMREGAEAWARAVRLDPKNAALRSQYGEAVMGAAGGTMTPEAAKIFDEALALDPKDPRARFYRGLALAQTGQEKKALDLWVQIIRDGPPDAEWMAGLREQARVLAVKLNLDPSAVLPPAGTP